MVQIPGERNPRNSFLTSYRKEQGFEFFEKKELFLKCIIISLINF
jgi:hypothetical protein